MQKIIMVKNKLPWLSLKMSLKEELYTTTEMIIRMEAKLLVTRIIAKLRRNHLSYEAVEVSKNI